MKNYNLLKLVRVAIIAGILMMGGMAQKVVAVEGEIDVGGEGGVTEDLNEPRVYIKAINPGYTVDGISNVGEMIEIAGKTDDSDEMILLAGITVRYTTSSGKETNLVVFPEYSYLAGESILLRYASSPGSELAVNTYTKTLAFEGSLSLIYGEEVMDTVCWTGKEGCVKKFKSASPTVLVRNVETGEFEHVVDYEPEYKAENYVIKDNTGESGDGAGSDSGDGSGGSESNIKDDSAGDNSDKDSGLSGKGDVKDSEDGEGRGEVEVVSQCKGLVFSEILSYYAESQTEQFIEFYNTGAEQILLDGCQVRYKNKLYPISGIVKAEGYSARYLTDFKVTKNPTTSNVLEIIDTNGEVVDKLEYPNGQRKGTAWAWIGYDEKGEELWRTTYAVTPGEPNIYQEFRTCEEGKVINEATGNCVKVTEVVEKTCPEGQYLNPLTGRCKKIETTTTRTKECKEGYYYYEETGRCRKIVENNGANYSLVTETFEEKSSFVALYAVIGVVAVGAVYVIYEFRTEIRKLWRRVWKRFRS